MTIRTYSQAEHDQAVAAARTEGAKAERERISAVMGLQEAKGREAQALALATATDLTADQAKTVLAAAPATPAVQLSEGRASDSGMGIVTDGGKPFGATEVMTPDEVAARINAQNAHMKQARHHAINPGQSPK